MRSRSRAPPTQPIESMVDVLNQSVECLPGVGPKRRAALEDAGIATVGQLVRVVPRRYSDRRTTVPLSPPALERALAVGVGEVAVEGRLRGVRRIFTRRRGLQLVQGRIESDEGSLRCVWFNRPYLAGSVDEQQLTLLCGRLRRGRNGLELLNADVAPAEEGRGIVPHYPEVGGLGDKAVRRLVGAALEVSGNLAALEDPIPAALLRRHGLPELAAALRLLHAPGEDVEVDELLRGTTPAHQRLIYGELLAMQLRLARARRSMRGRSKAHRIRVDNAIRERARDLLSFRLTEAQRRSLKEIVDDLCSDLPMVRLLQGDVGCGKTVVAALAALVAAENGVQVAFLSPTEALAEQLAREIGALLAPRHATGLLSRSSEDAERVREELASGALGVVCGTHALFQEDVRFRRLGFVVIDEQHRFGVEQRVAMAAKGDRPDLLLMSATPIPRSLALAVYGDLDLSTIDELPAGRRAVTTRLVEAGERRAVLESVAAELESDGRVFVVFPRIDDSGDGSPSLEGLRSSYEGLGVASAVVTGRVSATERRDALESFRQGRVPLLLATTVIEVGIDVPEATLMVVEGAERFGLSQLHQLRGRVGRGTRPGTCLVVRGASAGEDTLQRLDAFAATDDGFELAELDLRLRGPGDLLGDAQSGFSLWSPSQFGLAEEWLPRARDDARALVAGEESPSRDLRRQPV